MPKDPGVYQGSPAFLESCFYPVRDVRLIAGSSGDIAHNMIVLGQNDLLPDRFILVLNRRCSHSNYIRCHVGADISHHTEKVIRDEQHGDQDDPLPQQGYQHGQRGVPGSLKEIGTDVVKPHE